MTYGFQNIRFEHFHYDVFRNVKTAETRDWDPSRRMTFTSNAAGRIDTVAVPLEPALPGGVIFKRKPAASGTANAGR
jgi:hypothetical protein